VEPNLSTGGVPVQISFRLSDSGRLRIAVFNSAGEFVKTLLDGDASALQVYTVSWDLTNFRGERVSSNVYLFRAIAPGLSRTFKVGVQR
jgi:hypothetical protein